MSTVMQLDAVTLEYPVPRQYKKENIQPSALETFP